MARETFTWAPDLSSEMSEEPLVTVSKFGDGYESRLETSINSMPAKWSVTFTYPQATYLLIRDFLRKQRAVKSFVWVSPDGEQGIFVCRSWKGKQMKFGVFQISATFEQVFEE